MVGVCLVSFSFPFLSGVNGGAGFRFMWKFIVILSSVVLCCGMLGFG